MQFVRARQAEYDRYNALPRNIPDRTWNEAEFAAKLDGVMCDNEVKRGAVLKVKLKEAMEDQVAERRHAEWTNKVYLPIANTLAASVDASFPAIHRERQRAMEGYLRATDPENVSGGLVFLNGNQAGGAQSYDPWVINSRASIRVGCTVQDPLKTVLHKREEEDALLATARGDSNPAAATSASKLHPRRHRVHEWLDAAPRRLAPEGWGLGNLETQPFGHFEIAEARSGGVFNMAFAGMDTASTWRGYDFDPASSFAQTGPCGRPGVGRVKEIDAEFPYGKRMEEDPKRAPGKLYSQRGSLEESSERMTIHRIQGRVYDYAGGEAGKDGVFSDAPLLDRVRPSHMEQVPPSIPAQGYGNPHSAAVGGTAKGNRYAQQPFPREVGEQLGSTYRRALVVRPEQEGDPKFQPGRTTIGTTLNTQTGHLSLR